MKYPVYLTLLVLSFTSCFKKEKPITLPEATSEISTHYMGDKYSKQLYFDLSTNTFYENQLTDWDLCFESSDNGNSVFFNTGKEIQICKAMFGNLGEQLCKDSNYANDRFKNYELIEGPDGKDSTSAFRDWESYRIFDAGSSGYLPGIYYIKLPYLSGLDRFRRLQIISVNDSFFICKFSKLDEDYPPITKIFKNKTKNFTFYSFKNGGRVVENVEPPKKEWDIEFTRYRTFLHNVQPPTLYTLNGVFSNRNNVIVATDFSSKFEDISGNSISNYVFSSDRDAIGYDYWKIYTNPGGSGGKYVVNPNITYIIKDTDGYYYKLHFLDFYDKQGRTGNPKFEYIRIR